MNPIRFRYRDDTPFAGESEFVGVSAQEMQQVAPYMVKTVSVGERYAEDAQGRETLAKAGEDYLAYDPSALVYLLVNAVQDQQSLIEEQRRRIDALEERIGR